MTEQKHTSGPWVVDPNSPRDISPADDLRFGVASICNSDNIDGRWVFGDESKANAKLIAAAPDLLAALTKCLDVKGTLGLHGLLDEVEAAIAKATQ